MLDAFFHFVSKNKLFEPDHKILVAVSGGIDSVVLLDLITKSSVSCAIAHCNFHLRADESDNDELFVKDLSAKYQIPFFKTDFDTVTFASQKGISIQMAARDLRYKWFEEIRTENHFDFIAIGHNMNDTVETFFTNLTRGTGIRGLTGIKPKTGKLIRPLLFARRIDIEKYCSDNDLFFREDSSNSEVKYMRNKIRHEIIPVFLQLNPNFHQTMLENFEKLKEVEQVFFNSIHDKKEKIVIPLKDKVLIKIEELQILNSKKTYLFEFLKPYNFSSELSNEIAAGLESLPGKQFFSPTHKLIKDREYLVITKIVEKCTEDYILDNCNESYNFRQGYSDEISLSICSIDRTSDFTWHKDPDVAYLDFDSVKFPMTLRKWRKGDFFIPLGMNHRKKISDFFIDNKLSLAEKENTWLISSGDNIIWIVGLRIDNRYKITGNTSKILIIENKNSK